MKTPVLLFTFALVLTLIKPNFVAGQGNADTLNYTGGVKQDFQWAHLRLLILAPSLELELSLRPDFNVAYGANFLLHKPEGQEKNDIVLYHTFAFRYYYNLEKRRMLGKKASKLSGNFASLNAYYIPDIKGVPTLSAGFSWGMYRNPVSFLTVGLEVRCHFYYRTIGFYIYPKVGIVL